MSAKLEQARRADEAAVSAGQHGEAAPSAEAEASPKVQREPLLTRALASVKRVDWRMTLLISVAMAAGWCLLFLSNNWLTQTLAGIVPVMAGLFLGRRAPGDYVAHGVMLGLTGFGFGFLFVSIYALLGASGVVPLPELILESGQAPTTVGPSQLLGFYLVFSLFALIPFPAFGTIMGGRNEEQRRELQRQVDERGGRLEKPGVIRTREDIGGLSLPQLGSFIASLYRKKGFEFKDYRFIDKDKHLDLEMSYQGQTYLMRLSVADKVRPGTVESLTQDMKRRGIFKGIVITNTEFTPDTAKAIEARRYLLGIDGDMLFLMNN